MNSGSEHSVVPSSSHASVSSPSGGAVRVAGPPAVALPAACMSCITCGVHWWWFLLLGVLLVVCGTTAFVFPAVGSAVAIDVLSILLLIAGAATFIGAFWAGKWSGMLLQLLVGLLYIAAGFVITERPVQALVTITIFLAVSFIVMGAFHASSGKLAAVVPVSAVGLGALERRGDIAVGRDHFSPSAVFGFVGDRPADRDRDAVQWLDLDYAVVGAAQFAGGSCMSRGSTERRKPSRKEILIALAIGGAIGATVFAIQHWPRHTDGASPAHEESGDPTAAPKAVDRQSNFGPTAPIKTGSDDDKELAAADHVARNPQSAAGSFDPGKPGQAKDVQRGASFLCADEYCTRCVVGSHGKSQVKTARTTSSASAA